MITKKVRHKIQVRNYRKRIAFYKFCKEVNIYWSPPSSLSLWQDPRVYLSFNPVIYSNIYGVKK